MSVSKADTILVYTIKSFKLFQGLSQAGLIPRRIEDASYAAEYSIIKGIPI